MKFVPVRGLDFGTLRTHSMHLSRYTVTGNLSNAHRHRRLIVCSSRDCFQRVGWALLFIQYISPFLGSDG